MANIKSAKKKMRKDVKRREANRVKKSANRTYEKKVRALVAENKMDEAQKAFEVFASAMDKTAKTNLVHPNRASRKKSRLALLLNKAKAALKV